MRSPAGRAGAARVVAGGGLPECAIRRFADRKYTYAPAAGSAGRTGMRWSVECDAATASGQAAAILACGGGLRIVERIKHRPVSGQMGEVRNHLGNRHYACLRPSASAGDGRSRAPCPHPQTFVNPMF